jgi:nucleoside-diphosphate-sugar epimerase
MRVFLAGATGVMGRALTPLLLEQGHEVVGMTRSAERAEGLRALELVRRRRLPVVGSGEGRWSFIHVQDAAAATLAALERGSPGVYNIVDDEPAPAREWIPVFAETLGAKAPRRAPEWLGRLAGGQVAVAGMTTVRGASNAKAKRELGWSPARPSWRGELGRAS